MDTQKKNSWDARVSEELGNHAECYQPRQSREQMHSGMLYGQSANVALPVKQHTEYHRPVKIVREREQEPRRAGRQSHAGSTTSTPIFFAVVSVGWLLDEFVVG